MRAAEVLRDLAAVGEAGRAVGVVLAPWEEQTSSLSQRTGGVTKIRCKVELLASRTAQLICTVVSGELEEESKGLRGKTRSGGRGVWGVGLSGPTDPEFKIHDGGSSGEDPQLKNLS